MYTYKFTDEESKKIEDKAKLFEQFKSIDDKFSLKEEGINLNKMEYTAPTAEEVETQAQASLQSYLTSGKDNIEQDYSEKYNSLNSLQQSNKNVIEEQKTDLESNYSKLKENASNDMIKRGLARSSIVVNILDAFDKDMINKYNELDKEYRDSFQKLENEKSLLESQKQSALSAFDISYASKLTEKIDEINKEIDKKETEVLKYNNEIAEKEAKYQKELDSQNKELIKFISDYGTETISRLKQDEKYNLAYSYFINLPKEEALGELLSNPEMQNQLGAVNYKKLQNVLRNM